MKPENIIIQKQDFLNAGYITEELLPCPFCGKKNPVSVGHKNEKTGNIGYKVICTDHFGCGATIHNCFSGDTPIEEIRADIVTKWNKRSIYLKS